MLFKATNERLSTKEQQMNLELEKSQRKGSMDYFDDKIGQIENVDFPNGLEFAAALLSEMLVLTRGSKHHDRFRLGTILVHLGTRIKQDFLPLYHFYNKIVNDVEFKHFSSQMVDRIYDRISEACEKDVKFDFNILELEAKLFSLGDHHNGDHHGDVDGERILDDKENLEKEMKITQPRPRGKSNNMSRKRGRPKKREFSITDCGEATNDTVENGQEATFHFKCDQCEFSCNQERNLDKHKFEVHSNDTTCSQCGIKFQAFQDYEQHTLMHVYHCEVCKQPFAGVGALRLHKQKHLPQAQNRGNARRAIKGERNVVCKICKERFNKKEITQHIKEVHKGKDLLSCEKCEYTTWNRGYLKDHVKRVHFLQHISCSICGKIVKNLDKHIDRCHVTEGGLPCDQCGKLFAAKANLQTHINNIHKQIKDYHCDQCTYSTYTKHNLRLHMKSHTGETSERECGVCGKTTNSLDWHINLFHKDHYEKLKSESQ